MYCMTNKYCHLLLDGLHLVLVVDVREGVQHVSEVLKIILIRFLAKKTNDVRHDKNVFSSTRYLMHDGLHLVLVVDVHEGVDDEKNLRKAVLQLVK